VVQQFFEGVQGATFSANELLFSDLEDWFPAVLQKGTTNVYLRVISSRANATSEYAYKNLGQL